MLITVRYLLHRVNTTIFGSILTMSDSAGKNPILDFDGANCAPILPLNEPMVPEHSNRYFLVPILVDGKHCDYQVSEKRRQSVVDALQQCDQCKPVKVCVTSAEQLQIWQNGELKWELSDPVVEMDA